MSNTPHGGDSCKNSRPSDHHNIPTSRGGSDDPINISDVQVTRHEEFHKWAHNRTPCQLTRDIALHSLSQGKSGIGTERMDTLFEITTLLHWKDLYDIRAFKVTVDPDALMDSLKHMSHLKTQVLQEIVWVRQTMEALDGCGNFPTEHHGLLPQAFQFFSTKSAAKAIEGLFTEEHFGMRSWTKPVSEKIRDEILDTVRTSKKRDSSDKYTIEVLKKQEKRLEQQNRQIERIFRQFNYSFTPSKESEATSEA